MPQPITVVLIASSWVELDRVKRSFRFTMPGIGSSFLAAIDAPIGGKILRPSSLPKREIIQWVALDSKALALSKRLHARDIFASRFLLSRYSRGFYRELLPEACVLVSAGSSGDFREDLEHWRDKIAEVYLQTS